jgi:hypothetical protein
MTNIEIMNINDSGFSLDDDESSKPKQKMLTEQGKPLKEDKQIKQEIASIAKKKRKDPEKIEKHQEMVIMLSRYGQSKRFAEFLKSMGFNLSVTHLKKCELDELEEILARVKTAINNKNVSNFWEELAFGVIQTGEIICTKTSLSQRIKIQGISEMLKSDDTFLDLLEQVELENQNLTYVSPYIRMLYAVVGSAMKCHGINTMLEQRMKMMEKQMKDTETNKEEGDEVIEEEVREPIIVEEEEEEKTSDEKKSDPVLSFDEM